MAAATGTIARAACRSQPLAVTSAPRRPMHGPQLLMAATASAEDRSNGRPGGPFRAPIDVRQSSCHAQFGPLLPQTVAPTVIGLQAVKHAQRLARLAALPKTVH